MRVPLLDLSRQHERVRSAVEKSVLSVFSTQQFILGKTVSDFEQAFCELTGCAHAIGMSSGTDAQLAILMAMGIGAGDAVVTTPYTFFATAGCIHRTGAEIVFVDVRPDTLHMDPEKLRECLTAHCQTDAEGVLRTPRGNRVKAITPIHLFGSCCDMDALAEVAKPWGILFIEDAAQAIGAQYPSANGTVQAGAIGHSAYFSFFPTKNLGAAGDAGISVCHDAEFAEKLRLVRNHGMERRYFHHVVGGNFRIDAIQAAVLHAKMPFVDEWNAGRRKNAALYREGFAAAGLQEFIQIPAEPWSASGLANHHIYHQYVVRAKKRNDLMRHLEAAQIGCAIYYPVALHLQECFADLGYQRGDFPVSETASDESLALPIFPELREEEIQAVVSAIAAFYKS